MADRALSPVVGVVCLLAVTVILAAVVGASVTVEPPSTPNAASFEAAADPSGEVTITHRSGDTIDPETIDLRVRVNGEPLERQPPVPFFSARGFESAPTGPFNSATARSWRAGETASFTIAGTNHPRIRPGDAVTVEIFADDHRVARLETTV